MWFEKWIVGTKPNIYLENSFNNDSIEDANNQLNRTYSKETNHDLKQQINKHKETISSATISLKSRRSLSSNSKPSVLSIFPTLQTIEQSVDMTSSIECDSLNDSLNKPDTITTSTPTITTSAKAKMNKLVLHVNGKLGFSLAYYRCCLYSCLNVNFICRLWRW